MTITINSQKILTFQVSKELDKKLYDLAEGMERPKSFVIRKAVEKYLEEKNATTN